MRARDNFHVCRFCKKQAYIAMTALPKPERPLFEYALRHWSHLDCGMKHFGREVFLDKLNDFQLETILEYSDTALDKCSGLREQIEARIRR